MIELSATFFAGTFFGAALYVSLAQHPATIDTGGDFPRHFFPRMYRRAAPMQVALALGGTVLGIIEWYLSGLVIWLVGAMLLVSVIPTTLVVIKPINDQLLHPDHDLDPQEIESLLRRWSPRHWIRTIASGMSFLSYLAGVAN